MSTQNIETIEKIVGEYPDPETGRSLRSMGQVKEVSVDDSSVIVTIALTTHSMPIREDVAEAIESRIVAAVPGSQVKLNFVIHERPPARIGQIGLRAKSVIAVGSGKGGVGKSTVAASIALTLRRFGAKVGLMDADVYGPSIPHLLGLSGRPSVSAAKRIEPIKQFLGETEWGDLDYLIIDMPPGTGDVALTLSQALPLAGAVVVCTPQEVALLDAIKAISMFRKVNIPVLGMVENMSGFRCPDNNKIYDIFGRGGAREKAEELTVPFLGALPIEIALRTAGDEGRLAEVIESDAAARAPIDAVTQALVRNLAAKASASPPKASLPTL
jgi:ATP-binding protein involved in chromosome partitioning